MKTLIIILFLLFSYSVNAEPFKLNTYGDVKTRDIGIKYSVLNNLSSGCMYDRGWLDYLDVKLKGGVSTAQGGYQEGQDSFVGLAASVPLYSGKELSRERDRTFNKKRQLSDDVEKIIEGVEKVMHNRRIFKIYKVLELRSQQRVANGVVPLTEQIKILEKISSLRKEILTYTAQIGGRYNALLNSCEKGKGKRLLKDYMDEHLSKLNIKF